MAEPEELLRELCRDLRLLWTQAGGPSLRTLGAGVGLGKSQVGAILNGRIRRPPDWEVVRCLIDTVQRYAHDHDRLGGIALRTGVEEYWKPRYAVLEHAFRHASASSRPDAPRASRTAVPRQLPAPPAPFTGRTRELSELSAALDARAGSAATVLVSGMGGIGKTWLALHWAHRHADRFPDGQLFVDLRGFSPTEEPVAAAGVVSGFLTALGVPGGRIPADLDAQVGLYRSLMAGRRMLIVLDNARTADQVVPLLPGSPTCSVLITSRDRLPRLVNAHGARPLALDVLAEGEAHELLAARIGARRLAAEPDTVAELVSHCAGLPLALGIVAGRALTQPAFPLAGLAVELRDATTRLTALADDDPAASLPAVLSWSSAALPAEQARVFRLLGIAPGPDIGLPAAASLTGLPGSQVRPLLRGLQRAHLVHEHVPGRYRMHDLVRLHAADRAHDDLPHTDRTSALRRLVDFYLHTADAAARCLSPHRALLELEPPGPGCHPEPIPDLAQAWAWLEVEQPCLLAAQQVAAEQRWHRQVWQLAWTLDAFHHRRGRLHDMITTWQAGLAAARHETDPAILIRAYRRLGDPYGLVGRHADAIEHLGHSLTLAERAGDLWNQAHTHRGLALTWIRQGDYDRALAHAASALRLFQGLGEPESEADSHNTVGWCATKLGRYEEAQTHLEAALTLSRRHDHLEGEAHTLDSLGYLAHHTGRHGQALEHYQQALSRMRELGDDYVAADILDHLGHTHTALGHHGQAGHAWRRALRLYRDQYRLDDADRIRRQLETAEREPYT